MRWNMNYFIKYKFSDCDLQSLLFMNSMWVFKRCAWQAKIWKNSLYVHIKNFACNVFVLYACQKYITDVVLPFGNGQALCLNCFVEFRKIKMGEIEKCLLFLWHWANAFLKILANSIFTSVIRKGKRILKLGIMPSFYIPGHVPYQQFSLKIPFLYCSIIEPVSDNRCILISTNLHNAWKLA